MNKHERRVHNFYMKKRINILYIMLSLENNSAEAKLVINKILYYVSLNSIQMFLYSYLHGIRVTNTGKQIVFYYFINTI